MGSKARTRASFACIALIAGSFAAQDVKANQQTYSLTHHDLKKAMATAIYHKFGFPIKVIQGQDTEGNIVLTNDGIEFWVDATVIPSLNPLIEAIPHGKGVVEFRLFKGNVLQCGWKLKTIQYGHYMNVGPIRNKRCLLNFRKSWKAYSSSLYHVIKLTLPAGGPPHSCYVKLQRIDLIGPPNADPLDAFKKPFPQAPCND